MVHIGSQSKFVPYVIEVDKLGQTHAVSIADRAAPADPRVIHSLLARAVTLDRMVPPDVVVQRNAIFELYASLNPSDPAALKMNEYLGSDSETSPFKRASKETVDVQITSVIPQSDETWQVDWVETVRARGDGSVIPFPYAGARQHLCGSSNKPHIRRANQKEPIGHLYS